MIFTIANSRFRPQTVIANGDDIISEKPKLSNGVVAAAAAAEEGDVAQVNGDKKKKKKKKKANKEALQKKKERKRFELEGQFEGQEMPTFTGILLNDNMNFAATNGEVNQVIFEKKCCITLNLC